MEIWQTDPIVTKNLRLILPVISYVDTPPDKMQGGRSLHLCGIPSNSDPQSNQKKASEKLKLREILENAWPVLFKDVSGTKHKKGLGNFTHQRNRKACYWEKW